MAYFRCAQEKYRSDTFVIELLDPIRIAHARAILNGTEKRAVHVSGRIMKEVARYNRPWHFHLDPQTIKFFEDSIEVCDASVSYVEEHLAEVGTDFLPNSWWCPWGSHVIEELPAEKCGT